MNYEEKLKEAEKKWKIAHEYYKKLRSECEHQRTVWKDKYGGYFCQICGRFLPRDFYQEESY